MLMPAAIIATATRPMLKIFFIRLYFYMFIFLYVFAWGVLRYVRCFTEVFVPL
nr:MAG TPA: hypothetical protein [Caudoviricetes sp.]